MSESATDLPVKADASDSVPATTTVKKAKRFEKLKKLSRWRQIAVGMWGHPTSPTVYGEQKLDMTNVIPFIKRVREEHGVKISPLHVFVKCVGKLFEEYPHFNVMLRRKKFFRRISHDVFIQVAIREGRGDLGGIKIKSVDQKTVLDLGNEIAERAQKVRSHQDLDMERSKKALERIPMLLMYRVVRTIDVLTNDLGLNLSFAGVKPDSWGGAMVTNIGSFGLPHGYAPLVGPSRVPILFCLGAAKDEPVVENGEVVVKNRLTVTGTFDHRVFDGFQLAKMCHVMKTRFEDPSWLEAEISAGSD